MRGYMNSSDEINTTNVTQLKNINGFEYLKEIAKVITPEVAEFYTFLGELKSRFYDLNNNEIDFDENFPYGELYSSFLTKFQNEVSRINQDQKTRLENIRLNKQKRNTTSEMEFLKDIDKIIFLIYANPNHALQRAAEFAKSAVEENMLHDITSEASNAIFEKSKGMSKSDDFTSKITKNYAYYASMFSTNTGTSIEQEHYITRVKSTYLDSTYQPMLLSNIPSIIEYAHSKNKINFKTEYRFSTQGEIINGEFRVNPMFIAWLAAIDRQSRIISNENDKQKISHIYFNNLALDRTDHEGIRERNLTLQLHKIEDTHKNAAIITLPADKGFFGHDMLDVNKKPGTLSIKDFTDKVMLNVTSGSDLKEAGDSNNIRDFYISNDIKLLLYGQSKQYDDYNKQYEQEIMLDLFISSVNKLGLAHKNFLTSSDQQAIYFHFVKFAITDFIIQTLNPDSINYSCKDAIDRGGVSSLYYNLIKSIETDQPMSNDEFFRALHGAPTLVKARGMNDHLDKVWNTISLYVEANKDNIAHPIPNWLIAQHFIKQIISNYTYTNFRPGTTLIISDNDYNNFTSGINHNKLSGDELSTVKARISEEFIKSLIELSHNPENLSELELILNVEKLTNEALMKSENACYQGKILGRSIYHDSGRLEKNLIKILEKTNESKYKLDNKKNMFKL